MKTKMSKTLSAAVAVAALSVGFAGATLAAGSHQGGHGDGMAFGKPGKANAVDRTIEVVATDNAFDQEKIQVKDGETIRFVVRNEGDFVHEFNIGTPQMHKQHQAEMAMMMQHGMMTATSINRGMMNTDHSQMAMRGSANAGTDANAGMMTHMQHDDPNSILLEPGETREIVWTFAKAGSIEFACNVPGHYESGMVGDLSIGR